MPCNQLDVSKTTEIFSAVDRGNIDRLKSLLDSPEWYTVEQNHYTILQYAVLNENKPVFDFLLSIEDFPLDATCKANLTALIVSFGFRDEFHFVLPDEYYALKLLNKGANIHQVDVEGNSVLHLAVRRRYRDVCRFILEKGIDVNAENDNLNTALRVFLENDPKFDPDVNYETILMLLYYNADVHPTNDSRLASDLFEWGLSQADTNEDTVQEVLYFYIEDFISELQIPILNLLQMMLDPNKKTLVLEILDYDLDFVIESRRSSHCSYLFCIDGDFLRILVEKFACVIEELLMSVYSHIWMFNSKSIENFEILFSSALASSADEFIANMDIERVVAYYDGIDNLEAVKDLIFYLLTKGLPVYDTDLNVIFKEFGYCDLFKILLHMDIGKRDDYSMSDMIPAIMFDIDMSIDTFLDDPNNFSLNAVEELLNYFSRQKLKDFCCRLNVQRLTDKTNKLPKVPSLVELARDSCRLFLISKYNVKTCRQFYTVLKWLPVGHVYKEIISFEKKIYVF